VTETTKIHFVVGPNRRITNPGWQTAAILKNRKTAISPQLFDRSAQNWAWWRTLALRRVWAVNISNFLKIQDGGRPPSWKSNKLSYLGNGLSDLHEIWHCNAHWHSEQYDSYSFEILKIQHGRWVPFWKIDKRPYLSNDLTDWCEMWHGEPYSPSEPFLYSFAPRGVWGTPFPPLFLPVPFSFSFSSLCYVFSFSFSHSLCLFSSVVHPIPFYRNRPTVFPGRRS